jgi:serine/threonine protein kinase
MPLSVGDKLGHYEIRALIGAGGMGEIYRAYDRHLERDVALKILPAGLLSNEGARKRFRHEALALSKLNHPNIATVFDFDTQDGTDFLAMELGGGAQDCSINCNAYRLLRPEGRRGFSRCR